MLGAGAASPAALVARDRAALRSLPRLLGNGLGVNRAAWSGPKPQQWVIGWQSHVPDSTRRVRHPRSTTPTDSRTPQTPTAKTPGPLRQPAANETDLVLLAWMAATALQRPSAPPAPTPAATTIRTSAPSPRPRRKHPLAHQPSANRPLPPARTAEASRHQQKPSNPPPPATSRAEPTRRHQTPEGRDTSGRCRARAGDRAAVTWRPVKASDLPLLRVFPEHELGSWQARLTASDVLDVLEARCAACACRKLRRGWSGSISVLVDESATAGRSYDLEVSIWLV